jgi:hypothetical protein
MAEAPASPVDPVRQAQLTEWRRIVRRRFGSRRDPSEMPRGARPADEEPEPIPAAILARACEPAWAVEMPEPRAKILKDVTYLRADGVWCTLRTGQDVPPEVSQAQCDQWVLEKSAERRSLRTIRFRVSHLTLGDRLYDDLYGKLGIVTEEVAKMLCAPAGRSGESWARWRQETARNVPPPANRDAIVVGDFNKTFPVNLVNATDADCPAFAELIPDRDYYRTHNTAWKGDPNTLPPCGPPANREIKDASGVYLSWTPSDDRRRTRHVRFVYGPGAPERCPALVPLWVEEREAGRHAREGRGTFLDVRELGEEELERLATAKEVPPLGVFFIVTPTGEFKFQSPDDLPDERMAADPVTS